MKFEILSRIKSVFKDMSAFKNFRNLKRVIYQSEMNDNFGSLNHVYWTPTGNEKWPVRTSDSEAGRNGQNIKLSVWGWVI